ncbi:MAG TPA: hypothetical protein VFE42_06045, partial [Chloroflexota bacterium]|nr:hypothetical protein [Chloroflexota bacterium]
MREQPETQGGEAAMQQMGGGPALPALRPLLVLTNSGRENPTLLRIGEDLVQVGLRLQEAGLDGLVAVED